MMIELTDLAVLTETYATEFLAAETGLSKSKIKTTMTRGAVWLTSGSSRKRLRRAKAKLAPGDLVSIYYSPEIMETVPTFLVHRLDRYVWGLMVLAHSKSAATHLSGQFQDRKTTKIYHAIVHGKLADERVINTPIDNKIASSTVRPINFDADTSLIEVRIETGRKHQIRQHLASIDHPVVGDRQYGSKDMQGIQLAAVELGFESPVDESWQHYTLADQKRPAFRPQEAK